MASIIELSDVRKGFAPGREALCGVSLRVAAGEVVGLIGRSGAGKTTLLRTTLGLLVPSAGTVRVFGVDPRVDPVAVKRRVGWAAEGTLAPAHLTVGDLIAVHRSLFPTWDPALEAKLAARLGVPRGAKLSAISKGEARKALLLCAIAHRPELLILDEPGGGLDPATRREFLEASIELDADDGTTILFSSHHMGDVERIATRVVVLESGKKLLDADHDALRESHCLATFAGDDALAARASALPGVVRVRRRGDSVTAVLACAAGDARAVLAPVVTEVDVSRAGLEELFVALAGASS